MNIQSIPKPGGDHSLEPSLHPHKPITVREGISKTSNQYHPNLEPNVKWKQGKTTHAKIQLALSRQDITVFANNMEEYPDLQVTLTYKQ